MNTYTIKWFIFFLLILIPPSMLFMVQVVFFMPCVFLIAGMIYMIPKILTPSQSSETFWFMLIFGVHTLIYIVIYYIISWIIAKVTSFIRPKNIKTIAIGIIGVLILIPAFLPVYGGGGHGPVKWMNLFDLFKDINKDYGSYSVLLVYLISIFTAALIYYLRKNLKKRIRE